MERFYYDTHGTGQFPIYDRKACDSRTPIAWVVEREVAEKIANLLNKAAK